MPAGAIAIENPVGTAPAFIVETGRNAIISLPGVPREMETLMAQVVIPYLQKRYDLHEIIKIRTLHTGDSGEAWIDEQIGDLEARLNPTIGLTAHSGIAKGLLGRHPHRRKGQERGRSRADDRRNRGGDPPAAGTDHLRR